MNAYLLGRLLDTTQATAGLTQHDAERIISARIASRGGAPDLVM